jgi:hypothetical protein
MEYDEHYGSIVCAPSPLNSIILPFQWISVFLKDKQLKQFNHLMCLLIYFPISVLICLYFLIQSIIVTPIAYTKHIYVLTLTILDSDETMDELSEKLQRVYTIVKWVLLGPFYLLIACLSDTYKFYINLFSKPLDADEVLNPYVLSRNTVQMFVDVCKEILVESNKKTDKFSSEVNFIDLNKKF